ncbi:MAG: hypothetical protein ACRDZ4_03690 [Egibacteraceae bacterium]
MEDEAERVRALAKGRLHLHGWSPARVHRRNADSVATGSGARVRPCAPRPPSPAETRAAGYETFLVDREVHPDARCARTSPFDDQRAAVIHYDAEGRPERADQLDWRLRERGSAVSYAVPLDGGTARHKDRRTA